MPRLHPAPGVALCALLLAATGCGDSTTEASFDVSALRLEPAGTLEPTATAGLTMNAPVQVRAVDPAGNSVDGIEIAWEVIEIPWLLGNEQASVEPLAARTDARGLAGANWTLGPRTGQNRLRASIIGNDSAEVVFRVNGTAGPVTVVTVLPASELAVDVGQRFRVGALAHDAFGNSIERDPPTWSSSNPAVVAVASDGLAEATAQGTAQLTATIGTVSAIMTVVVLPPEG